MRLNTINQREMPDNPTISLIVAHGGNGIIGKDCRLPWHLSNDLRWFKRHTLGKTLLMGSTTYAAVGRFLRDRNIIVLTSQLDIQLSDNSVICNSLQQAYSWHATHSQHHELMICGGANIYLQTIQTADRLYISVVDSMLAGDAYFPDVDYSCYQQIYTQNWLADDNNECSFTTSIWQRNDL